MAQLHKAIDELLDLAEVWQKNPSGVWGLPTGFASLDRLVGGLHPAQTTVLAARTNQGKSTLGIQIGVNVAAHLLNESNKVGEVIGQVLYFSPEMTGVQLIERPASFLSGVESDKIRRATATAEEMQRWKSKLEVLRGMSSVFTLDAGRAFEVADVLGQSERINRQGPPVKLIIVDYLQKLKAGNVRGTFEETSYISGAIKDLSNELKVPILLLSQLNRGADRAGKGDDPDEVLPRLSDLRGSGRIEEDADSVWLLHNPSAAKQTRSDNSLHPASLQVAKNRNGRNGMLKLYFNSDLAMFEDG